MHGEDGTVWKAALLSIEAHDHTVCEAMTRNSLCRTMQYKHVGSPIFLDRKGEALPGEYVAFEGERPEWYTGSIGDHVSGYILGIKQAAECSVKS